MHTATPQVSTPSGPRVVRWTLAAVGVLCVALGAAGLLIPGFPTTVFLLIATWCFARSCPWLERRLVRIPLFAPFLAYIDRTQPIPARAKAAAIAAMWSCVAGSILTLRLTDSGPAWIGLPIAGAAAIGTVMILRWDAALRA